MIDHTRSFLSELQESPRFRLEQGGAGRGGAGIEVALSDDVFGVVAGADGGGRG